MTHEKLIQSLYERFNARDIESLLELLQPDVEWVNEPKESHVCGVDELRGHWTRQKNAARVHFDIVSSTPGEKGAFVVVQEKVWVNDELIFDGPVGHDFTVRDGKIVRCDIVDAYPDE